MASSSGAASDPFEFFKNESSNADAVIRTEAMNKIIIILAVLGPEKSRDLMVPYLETKIGDLDQVLLAMSQKLGDFVPYIGGPEHTPCLIPLLELLCGIEETTVRVAACGSISKILLQLTPESSYRTQAVAYFDLFSRLSNTEDEGATEIFCSRVSAAYVLPETYKVLPPELQAQLLETFSNKLLGDDMAIVKRAAANSFLRTLSYCADPKKKQEEFLEMFKKILADENPTVKLIGIESLSTYAMELKEIGAMQVLTTEILPLVKAATEDPSWTVRKTIAHKFGRFAKTFTATEVTEEVFPGLINLIQDQEPDVRTLALKEMLAYLEPVGATHYLSVFVPKAVQLVDDPMSDSRKILTLLLIDVAAKVGAVAVAQHLSDLIMRLTVDEDPLVRLRVLQRLDLVAEEAPSLCTRLTEPLKTMFGDSNWRVRKQAALAAPGIMRSMGKEYLMQHFLPDLLKLLHDGVDEVRTAATTSLPKIAAIGGTEWAYEAIFPAIRSMANSEFLVRLSMLTALQGLIESNLAGSFQSEALALLVATTNDKVPNVRLRAAQVLGAACVAVGPENARAQIRPVLSALQTDKDRDVVFFATESMKLCA